LQPEGVEHHSSSCLEECPYPVGEVGWRLALCYLLKQGHRAKYKAREEEK